jgi:1-deoxy-D-xylulose-5-phosphate reductoisomerase
MDAVQKAKVQLIPVDSEHSAIFQALSNHPNKEVAKITLTASGGSLRTMSRGDMQRATVEQVLQHPTWTMGTKVTVDSASLMNKALELIEAHWLFGVGSNRLDAIIHPQSIVHGMVEFCDGSVIAQLSLTDMKLPIQYALTWPSREGGCCDSIDWAKYSPLEFETVDRERYPAVNLAYHVIERGGTAGAVFNAANEVVVASFLEHSLPFGSMVGIVKEVLDNISISDCVSFESVVEADREAREFAKVRIASHKVNT